MQPKLFPRPASATADSFLRLRCERFRLGLFVDQGFVFATRVRLGGASFEDLGQPAEAPRRLLLSAGAPQVMRLFPELGGWIHDTRVVRVRSWRLLERTRCALT